MMRTLSICTLLAGAILAITSLAVADSVTLNNGHVHRGKITAEEETRIQIQLESSGVRLWFPLDQVREFDVAEPVVDEEETRPETRNPQPALEGDVERARKMLEELRQKQLNDPTRKKNKRGKRGAAITKPHKKGKKNKNGPIVLTDGDVEILIQILRTHHDIYKRLDAMKKLGRAGASESIPDLIHALDDEVEILRAEANRSLIKITGQDFAFKSTDKRNLRLWSIDKWKEWHAGIRREKANKDLGSWF